MAENHVYLRIIGFEGPLNVITQSLKIEPTGGGLAGEKIPGKKVKIIRKVSSWDLKSSIDVEIEVAKHVDSLLSLVENHKSELLELTRRYDGVLYIAKYVSGEFNSEVHLRKDQLQKLADLNMEIVVDIYVT